MANEEIKVLIEASRKLAVSEARESDVAGEEKHPPTAHTYVTLHDEGTSQPASM